VILFVVVAFAGGCVLASAEAKASAERTPTATAPHRARNSHVINVASRARAARAAGFRTPPEANDAAAAPDQLWSERR